MSEEPDIDFTHPAVLKYLEGREFDPLFNDKGETVGLVITIGHPQPPKGRVRRFFEWLMGR